MQAAVAAAEEVGKQAKQQAEALEKEKSALQLEADDLKRHCKDLQDRALTLTVGFRPSALALFYAWMELTVLRL